MSSSTRTGLIGFSMHRNSTHLMTALFLSKEPESPLGSVPPLLSFLLVIVSGWVHRHQLLVIEFLQAENRLLKERLRGKRIRFTDAERTLLARRAKAVGRKALLQLDTVVSPDTL